MKRVILRIVMAVALIGTATPAFAQFNLKKAIGGATKAVQAFTLTDAQMAAYVKESVDWMDKNNPVLPEDDPYTQRLRKLTEGITDADGIPLNFKVYNVIDVNAFACPDGSVRVFSSLMDIMDDDELMGVIGHEIGHVASTGGKAAALTESQLGSLGQSLLNAKYSQKQEKEADDCGYDFLVSKGRNPWGIVKSFEKLQSLEGDAAQQSYIQKMFSSHPDTKKRIEAMTKRCQADGYTRP